jgi:hypothetical protein
VTHLRRDELLRWRDQAAESDRARVVSHLAECAACAAAYAELIRTRPAEDGPPVLQPEAFLRRGYSAAGPKPPRVWVRRWAPLAAAAVLAVALAGPLFWQSRVEQQPTLRGAELQELGPSGDVRPPFEFRWRAPGAAARYLVEVYDGDRRLIWRGETRAEPLAASEELLRRLRPDTEYRWLVTALDARGQTLAVSPLTPFRLSAR